MPVNNYEIVIRARIQGASAADPTLVATASGGTCIVDALVINGVEKKLTGELLTGGELTTLTAAVKQGVVDFLDNV